MNEIKFHIRRQLPRKGGNSFRKARWSRPAHTFCGAPVTAYDVAWRDRRTARDWKREDGAEFQLCGECRNAQLKQQLRENAIVKIETA